MPKAGRGSFRKDKYCIKQMSPLSFSPSSLQVQPLKVEGREKRPVVNKSRILLNLLGISFIMASVNSIIVPFYPAEAKKKGMGQTMVGFVFAVAFLGSFLSSLVFGKILFLTGRKNLILLGLTIQAVCVFGFGFLTYVPGHALFTGLSIAIRLLMGVSYAAFQSVAYSYVPLIFFDQIEEKMGQMETAFGIGQLSGPIIGSGLYLLGGYQCPFYVFAVAFVVAILLFHAFLPSDQQVHESLSVADLSQKEEKKALSIGAFLKSRAYVLTYLVPFFGLQGLGAVMATVSDMLSQKYGYSTATNGLIYSIQTIAYFVTMPLYNRLPKGVDRKVWLSLGQALNVLSVLLIAPQQGLMNALGVSNEYQLVFTCLGLAGIGAATAFIYIPILPQLIKHGNKIYPRKEDETKVNDLSVGFMNSGVNFSLCSSPILGGLLVQYYSYDLCFNVFGLVMAFYLLVFLLFCPASSDKAEALLPEEDKEEEEDFAMVGESL